MKIYDQDGLRRALAGLGDQGTATLPTHRAAAMERRRRRGLILSVPTLAASAVVHFVTYWPGAHIPIKYVWPLHILGIGALMYVVAAHCDGRGREPWSPTLRAGLRFVSEAMVTIAKLPRWALVTCIASMVYAAITFMTMLALLGGTAVQDGSTYWIEDHGTRIRTITAVEFQQHEIRQMRLFSTVWLELALAATMGFAYGPRGESSHEVNP
jgi:hypothetical protein